MEDKLYRLIIRVAIGILLIMSAGTLLIAKNFLFVCAIWLGGALSIGGFIAILFSTSHIDPNGNVQRKMLNAYIFRYLIYFVCMFIGAKAGLNILFMLLGFLCINLSIKGITFWKRKEDSDV